MAGLHWISSPVPATPPADTVLYGESAGNRGRGSAGCGEGLDPGIPWQRSFSRRPIRQSPRSPRTITPTCPPAGLVKDRFDAKSRIAAIAAPVLMMHAEDDRVIPFRFAVELFKAAVEPKENHWFPTGGHEGLFDRGADDLVIGFIDKHVGAREALTRP